MGLTIGDLGKATSTKVETIRYYERIGLLPKPVRTAGNYRAYSEADLDRLSFIRRARDLGFPLEQVCFRPSCCLACWTASPIDP